MDTSDKDARDSGASLETAELELALQLQDFDEADFGQALAAALEDVGGTLLFNMPMAESADCRHVAAVSLGVGEGRQFALVVQPPKGGMPDVERAEDSSNPLAGIVAAYAGLMDSLAAAA